MLPSGSPFAIGQIKHGDSNQLTLYTARLDDVVKRGTGADWQLVCDVPDHRWLGYSFGWNPVRTVIAAGRVVHDRASAGDTRPSPG